MDIANLQTFVTVAETGSFSHASDLLFLTQPAISKRVAALEEELGTPLFDRIGRKVSLTEAGRALLPRARSILLDVEDSRRAISNLSGQISGQLSIGTSHHIGLHRLPPVLGKFNQDYPEVELDIHFMDSEEACRAVEHGELELGIVTLPLSPPKHLRTHEIWPDPLSIVIGKSHPLAKYKQVDLEVLSEHSAILPATGTYTREVLEQAIAHSDRSLKVGMATNYLETIKMMVSIGLGWSVLPDSMLNKEIIQLTVTDIKLHRTLGIVWYEGRTLSNAAIAMYDLIRSEKNKFM